jgi:hypothetical protein
VVCPTSSEHTIRRTDNLIADLNNITLLSLTYSKTYSNLELLAENAGAGEPGWPVRTFLEIPLYASAKGSVFYPFTAYFFARDKSVFGDFYFSHGSVVAWGCIPLREPP